MNKSLLKARYGRSETKKVNLALNDMGENTYIVKMRIKDLETDEMFWKTWYVDGEYNARTKINDIESFMRLDGFYFKDAMPKRNIRK